MYKAGVDKKKNTEGFHYACNILFLYICGMFTLDTDTVDFTLLGVGYFCSPINTLELVLGCS